MSIRFKFRSSVNFDTIDIEGRSSISVAELRAMIIRYKKLNVCQNFDLVFSDAVSGQEFSDLSTRIPSGSSIIIKRVPAGKATLALQPIDVNGNLEVKDSHPFNPRNYQMDRFDDLGSVLIPVPEAMVPGCVPECEKERCWRSEKADIAAPRIHGPKFGSSDANKDVPRGYNVNEDNEKIKEQMKLEKVTAPDYAPKEIKGLPSELKCSVCNTYFKEAVMIPCCQHSFCNKCIRLVLVEKARCPKCSSNKCKVEDLLPNLSLRQAIKHFLASQIPSDSPEIDLCKYAPDGESGIQAEDVSCAVTILQREPELPHSPTVTGKGSNQVMEEPFYSSFIGRNALSVASSYRMSDLAAGREISNPTTQKGENIPLNLVQPNMHDEAYSAGIRKRGTWVENEGVDGNFVAAGRPNKVIRACYMCGSLGHLIRDCPVGSSPRPMLQRGPGMLQGGFPGYASSYWNGAAFPPPRPIPNIYTNPEMMSFSASAIPMMHYRAPPYGPSTYGALAPSCGIMRMGPMAPSAGTRTEHPRSHPERLEPVHCEKMKKISDKNLYRCQNLDEGDDTYKRYHYHDSERPLECRVPKEREPSASHSGDSFARRSCTHQHGKHKDSDAYSVDARCEKRSCSYMAGRDQKPYSERIDPGMQHMPNSDNKNGEVRYKHQRSSSRKHHERKGESHDDSRHGHGLQSDRDDFRWRVESNIGSRHKKTK